MQELVNRIRAMQDQGMTNNQVIQSLQKDGYTTSQIFESLNQIATRGEPTGQFPPPPRPQAPSVPPSFKPQDNPFQPVAFPSQGQSVEEVVEAVIDEKWNELVKDITTIIEWKNQTTTTIISLQQEFTDLKAQFDKLHQALIAKIGEYDKNILDVGAEVKAMEKVFSKVLPLFTENVSELARITKEMKR